MEIHAPQGPVHGFKDFLIHIAIVTLGILIAFGLEGLRETIHNRHLVRETRESMHEEMTANLEHVQLECGHVTRYSTALKEASEAMPALAQRSQAEFGARLRADYNPGYILVANAWETALSTGVLAHMPTLEVAAYAYAAQGVRKYNTVQDTTRPADTRVKAFAAAHATLTPSDLQQETELLLIFTSTESDLSYMCPQVTADIERAVRASAP